MSRLITHANWTVTGMKGCCGAGIISRITGSYVTKDRAAHDVKAWRDSNPTEPLLAQDTLRRLKVQTSRSILRLPSIPASLYGFSVPSGYFRGFAHPVEAAFWAILDDCRHMKYSMYLLEKTT